MKTMEDQSKDIEDSTCCICLLKLNDGQVIATLDNCAHQYHFYCIENWSRLNQSCPLDRIGFAKIINVETNETLRTTNPAPPIIPSFLHSHFGRRLRTARRRIIFV